MYDLISDPTGVVTEIRWIWKQVENESIIDANLQMVRIVAESIYIYYYSSSEQYFLFATEGGTWNYKNLADGATGTIAGDSFYGDGVVDVSIFGFQEDDINLIDLRVRDISGGDIAYRIREDG